MTLDCANLTHRHTTTTCWHRLFCNSTQKHRSLQTPQLVYPSSLYIDRRWRARLVLYAIDHSTLVAWLEKGKFSQLELYWRQLFIYCVQMSFKFQQQVAVVFDVVDFFCQQFQLELLRIDSATKRIQRHASKRMIADKSQASYLNFLGTKGYRDCKIKYY